MSNPNPSFRTTLGNMRVGSSWLDRQWVRSVPGVTITHGITQNNLIIRQGHQRPYFKGNQEFPYFRQ